MCKKILFLFLLFSALLGTSSTKAQDVSEHDQLIVKGNRLIVKKKYNEALATYNDALKLNPDSFEGLFNKGIVLDYLGRRSIIGKPTGIDVKEKKLTLPLIHALQLADRKDARQALRIIKNGAKQKDVGWIVDFVRSHGGIDYAVAKAESYAALAREDLAPLPESDAKSALFRFIEFVMERDS